MIETLFEKGEAVIIVIIKDKEIKFGSTNDGATLINFFEKFPELNIDNLNSEEEICDYIIKELEKKDYKFETKKTSPR